VGRILPILPVTTCCLSPGTKDRSDETEANENLQKEEAMEMDIRVVKLEIDVKRNEGRGKIEAAYQSASSPRGRPAGACPSRRAAT
jgi:hypothetical protein